MVSKKTWERWEVTSPLPILPLSLFSCTFSQFLFPLQVFEKGKVAAALQAYIYVR